MRFHFVVTARNAEPWIEACLESLYAQRDQAFTVSVVDDASTDRTAELVGGGSLVVNDQHHGALRNQWLAITALDGTPGDVVVIVDGDDRLAHDQVLNVLAGHYADPELVLTYGNYRPVPPSVTCSPARPYPRLVGLQRSFRGYTAGGNLLFNHLRSFRLDAVLGIDPARNFCWPNGKWFQACADTAIMIPLLEMAGTHYRCLTETLYLYNSANPSSDWRRDSAEIDRTHHYILNRLKPIVSH